MSLVIKNTNPLKKPQCAIDLNRFIDHVHAIAVCVCVCVHDFMTPHKNLYLHNMSESKGKVNIKKYKLLKTILKIVVGIKAAVRRFTHHLVPIR